MAKRANGEKEEKPSSFFFTISPFIRFAHSLKILFFRPTNDQCPFRH